MMRTYRIMYVLVLLGVLFCGLWGGGRLAPVLLGVLIVLPVISGIVLYLSMNGLRISLTGEHSCRFGQQIRLKMIIDYSFWCPAGNIQVELENENLVFGSRKRTAYLLALSKGRHHEYDICLDTPLCGGSVIRVQEIVCYGLLGLFSIRKPMKREFSCIIYPYEVQMYISLNRNREREQPGDIYDGKKSGTDVSEVFGLREYREGDPMQSIHWKLSGKMSQLIVREFGRPVNYHTLLLFAPAFCCGKREMPEGVINAVFDLGVSLSRALLNQNIAHFVGFLTGGELCCMPVDSMHGYEEMLLKLMRNPLQKNADDTLYSFINQQMYRQYTKVVYVTGGVNEAIAQNLAVLTDLTILEATEGHSGYQAGSGGYTVIGVSIEHMRDVEHVIPL